MPLTTACSVMMAMSAPTQTSVKTGSVSDSIPRFATMETPVQMTRVTQRLGASRHLIPVNVKTVTSAQKGTSARTALANQERKRHVMTTTRAPRIAATPPFKGDVFMISPMKVLRVTPPDSANAKKQSAHWVRVSPTTRMAADVPPMTPTAQPACARGAFVM